MGALNAPPLASFVADLAAKFAIREFIESGTFMGDACSFATTIFPSVTTIEISPEFQTMARQRHGSLPIRFLLGDSAVVLPEVVSELSSPAMFWLDGHAGGGNFGPEDCCPLLAELDAIARSPLPHYILVDDARAFLAPPPPPFRPEKWPTIVEVLDAARRSVPYYCVVIADTLICVPPEAKSDVIRFCSAVRPAI